MRIAIIGGLERTARHYSELAMGAGHEALFHDGKVRGRGARMLECIIDRSDLVVIVTDVNSHGAVRLARRRMREQERTPLLLRRFGLARFARLLAAITVRMPSVDPTSRPEGLPIGVLQVDAPVDHLQTP